MDTQTRIDLFHGLFRWHAAPAGPGRVSRHEAAPRSVPDPESGQELTIATIEAPARAHCPACAQMGAGGYGSFVADLRLAYACPGCRKLIWLPGA